MQPQISRVRTNDPEARTGYSPTPEASRLSDEDVERIAQRVAEILRPEMVTGPSTTVRNLDPGGDDPYLPVRRNKPQRPMSEY